MSTDSADTTSLLSHVSNLEAERKRLVERLQAEEARFKSAEEARALLESKTTALQQAKNEAEELLQRSNKVNKDEMEKTYNGDLLKFFTAVAAEHPEVLEQFTKGFVASTVKKAQLDNPMWKMMCCASTAYNRNVNDMQRITTEYNTLKQKVEGGTFRAEEARVGTKRVEPDQPAHGPRSCWDEFEAEVRGGGLQHYVPKSEDFSELRKEWTPLPADAYRL